MTDEPLCSCGSELYVIKGGHLACLTHCDGPDCCRSNEAHCRACKRYADNMKRRYTEAGS